MNAATMNGQFSANGHVNRIKDAEGRMPNDGGPGKEANDSAEQNEKKKAERDARGRFAKGNSGGPGNPFARYTAMLRKAFVERVTPEDIEKIVDGLLAAAQKGDVQAAKLVLAYCIGKPGEMADPDRVDHDEMAGYVAAADFMAKATDLMTQPAAGLPVMLVREMQPAMSAGYAARMAQMMVADPQEMKEVQERSRVSPAAAPRFYEEMSRRAASQMQNAEGKMQNEAGADEGSGKPASQGSGVSPQNHGHTIMGDEGSGHRQESGVTAGGHRQQSVVTESGHRQQSAVTRKDHRHQTDGDGGEDRQETEGDRGSGR